MCLFKLLGSNVADLAGDEIEVDGEMSVDWYSLDLCSSLACYRSGIVHFTFQVSLDA